MFNQDIQMAIGQLELSKPASFCPGLFLLNLNNKVTVSGLSGQNAVSQEERKGDKLGVFLDTLFWISGTVFSTDSCHRSW